MTRFRKHGWALAIALGLVVGLVLGGLWPRAPLHATATDRVENFAMATGFVDPDTEAVFYLDYLTGILTGATVSRRGPGLGFQAVYTANVHRDLTGFIQSAGGQPPQSPNYLLVTGSTKLPNTRNMTFGNTIIYVAETNSGVVIAYAVPWSQAAYSANTRINLELIPWAADKFGGAVLRPD